MFDCTYSICWYIESWQKQPAAKVVYPSVVSLSSSQNGSFNPTIIYIIIYMLCWVCELGYFQGVDRIWGRSLSCHGRYAQNYRSVEPREEKSAGSLSRLRTLTTLLYLITIILVAFHPEFTNMAYVMIIKIFHQLD